MNLHTSLLLAVPVLFATPAAADIPTIDAALLDTHQDRHDNIEQTGRIDRSRLAQNKGVTCAVYRPGRKGDPVAAANANPSIASLVRRVAREEGVDESQFMALVYQESRFNPCAKSGAGAIGLAQLMPGTASDLGVQPYDIEDNLRGGARYFRQQLRRFHGNVSLALAAYNSGSGNVETYGGIPPFRETQDYVRTITQKWLPAFGGSDAAAIPRNFGDSDEAIGGMRSSTINAMALSNATAAGAADVTSWFEQFDSVPTGTEQDSWDRNSGARNANIAMLNAAMELTAGFADLINSRNAVTLSDISGANRSGGYDDNGTDVSSPASGRCNHGAVTDLDDGTKTCGPAREMLLEAQ